MPTNTQDLVQGGPIDTVLLQSGVSEDVGLLIRSSFSPFFAQAEEWRVRVSEVTEPKLARKSRLLLKKIRVEAEKKHKELKAETLSRGKALDGMLRLVTGVIEPLELTLSEIETAAERAEAQRKATLRATREAQLIPLGVNPAFYMLAEMSEVDFANTLEGARAAFNTRKAAAEKAEADRLAQAKAEAEAREAREKAQAQERERMRIENERLKAEAEVREAAARAEREKALKELEEQKAEARAKVEAAEIERKRQQEIARIEHAALEAKAKSERDEREKCERELRAVAERESARLTQIEAEKERAALAPDREKLAVFAATIRGLQIPALATEKGKRVQIQLADQVNKFAAWVEGKAVLL
jgi:hypothetical protein